MGLVFVPLSIFIAFNFRNVWSYVTVFIFTSFLLSIHAPSAISLAIILAPFILLNLRGNFKHSLGLTLALAVPFLIPFPWIFDLLLPTARELFVPQSLKTYADYPPLIRTYGYLPVLFSLLGIFVLAIKRGQERPQFDIGLTGYAANACYLFYLPLRCDNSLRAGTDVYDADAEHNRRRWLDVGKKPQTTRKAQQPTKSTSAYGKYGQGTMPGSHWSYPGYSYSSSPKYLLLPYDRQAGLRGVHLD